MDDFDLTAGFFQAMLDFSKIEVGENLETLSLSDSLFYFYTSGTFTFILKEGKNSTKSREEVAIILEDIAGKFFREFPEAINWDGNRNAFMSFTTTCDEILQSRPTRKGFPILYRIGWDPLFVTPILHVVPVAPKNEPLIFELQYHLKRYAEQLGRANMLNGKNKPFLLYLPKQKQITYICPFDIGLEGDNITHFLAYVTEENDWFSFYQVMVLFYKRVQNIIPPIALHLDFLEDNPAFGEIEVQRPKIQQMIFDWADLNQYISAMSALLSEEFFKSGVKSEDVTEEQSRANFIDLLTRFTLDFDKVLNAALSQKQVLFVSP